MSNWTSRTPTNHAVAGNALAVMPPDQHEIAHAAYMNDFNGLIALLESVILMIGLVSKWLSASPFPPTLVALFIGIALGPKTLNLINLDANGEQASHLEKIIRLTLGIGLVGVALPMPSEYPRKNCDS